MSPATPPHLRLERELRLRVLPLLDEALRRREAVAAPGVGVVRLEVVGVPGRVQVTSATTLGPP